MNTARINPEARSDLAFAPARFQAARRQATALHHLRRSTCCGALFGLFAVALLAGCGSHADSTSHADDDGHGAEPAPAVVFKAGRGLQLGQTAAQFIGLATTEVAARDLPGATGVPAIPESALLHTVRGEFVFVANGDWFLRTPVEAGAAAEGWVEIRDGLYEGDVVVAGGARALWLAEIQAVNGGVSCTHGH